MEKTLVIYRSKYGAAEKYARWLAQALHCEAVDTKALDEKALTGCGRIALIGGIYGGGIAGLAAIKKNLPALRGSRIAIAAVGASPYDPNEAAELRARNFSPEMAEIPLYYLRGAWHEEKMSWPDRTLCRLLKKSLEKKEPAQMQPWEKALFESVGGDFDWTDRENLTPMIQYLEK